MIYHKREIQEDLDRLDLSVMGGAINICQGDGYYAKSLEKKYGISIPELRKKLKNKFSKLN